MLSGCTVKNEKFVDHHLFIIILCISIVLVSYSLAKKVFKVMKEVVSLSSDLSFGSSVPLVNSIDF